MTPSNPSAANTPDTELTLIRGGAIDGFAELGVAFDGEAAAQPGAVVVAEGNVIAAGPTGEIDRRFASDARHVLDLPGCLILPGLINAHAHLELTAIGPQPYGGDFIGWVEMLRKHMPNAESGFAQAAAAGAAQAKAAGVQAVGDITRFSEVAKARRDADLGGTSFIEVFGMGPPWDAEALAALLEPNATHDGVQPHAPYSAGPALFEAACTSGRPLSCHLAETIDEARFVAKGDGRFLELLQAMGKWSPDFATHYGRGQSPVQWMAPYLRRAPWLLAHCNYVDDEDIALLAQTGASVAYCPIASEYFGHHTSGGRHRYRDMLDAGVNVCLGTDSIVCQPPADVEPQPLGILPQMRRLYQRDHTDPKLLLRMATTHGQNALQLNGRITRLAAVPLDPDDAADPLTQTLLRTDPVESLDCAALASRMEPKP